MSFTLPKATEIPKTSFGGVDVAESTPMAQITAQYGLLDNVFTATLGGSVSTQDSMFVASTGASSIGVAVISTKKQVQYKAGQGIKALFTALYDTPVANNTQFAGLQNSESLIGFGYNGTDFGIGYATGGDLSVQELRITTPASGSENATVTIDGTPYTVGLTTGTVELNAYQIAQSLNIQVAGYDFTSNEDTVFSLANLPELGNNSFAFSSATAVGVWVEKTQPVIPNETWTPLSDWSEYPNYPIDPQKGNVFKIQFQYLGFGGIKFFIEDSVTADFVHVHTIPYANENIIPSVPNPIFRLGWAVRNTGNITNITVKGASAGIFVEGKNVIHGSPEGASAIVSSVGTTATTIVGLRNRMVFNDLPNRSSINTVFLSLATDTAKTAIFEIWSQPETPSTEELNWKFYDPAVSIAEITESNATISDGKLEASFFVKSTQSLSLNLSEIVGSIDPQSIILISARVSANPVSEMAASIIFKEDK